MSAARLSRMRRSPRPTRPAPRAPIRGSPAARRPSRPTASRRRGSPARRACRGRSRALLIVPDRLPATLTQTIASAPAAKQPSKASRKSPGLDAAVVGNGASGAVIRFQNSSTERSTPARKLSRPEVDDERHDGDAWPLLPSPGVRSLAESVTIATLATAASLPERSTIVRSPSPRRRAVAAPANPVTRRAEGRYPCPS